MFGFPREIWVIAFARAIQYFAGGLLAYVLPIFLINSKGISESNLALLYVVSYLFLFLGMFVASHASLDGNGKKLLVIATFFVSVANFGLLRSFEVALIALFFVLGFVMDYLFSYIMDVFLEHYTSNDDSGKVRGMYISVGAFSWLVATFVSLYYMGARGDYSLLFGLSVSVYILLSAYVVMFIENVHLDKRFDRERLTVGHAVDMIVRFWRDLDLRRVFLAKFALFFFYAFIVPFATVYMIDYLGLDWKEMAYVYLVLLSPFVFLGNHVGRWSDGRYSERVFMVAGIVLIGVFTVVLGVFSFSNWVLVALVLFGTRVGASLLDTASESYFFKKVDDGQGDYVAIFRTVIALAGIVSSALSAVVLYFANMKVLFIVGGVVVALFIVPVMKLRDL